ncbi:hypothetical protein Gotri_007589 [Gossypium trilobum]|uniref:Uncharacterized protein n=1 Tax=Gossypium trilobum TaxID=34281 RepID=A0A7J9EGK7_9ROSI|nr:hypothetical protein [Gossypium trilobum]
MAIQRITVCVGRCGKFGHRKDQVSNGKSSIGSEFRHDMGRFSTLSHAVDDYGWNEKKLEPEERGGIKINPRKQEGQLKKQCEKLTGKFKDVVFDSTPLTSPSLGFHFKASSSNQIVLDLARLDSLIGPPFGVNIIDRTPSNHIVNLNHVPSPLKDVGKLASFIVSKDMAIVTPQNRA